MPILYGPRQAYPWKNELALQRERVGLHFAEMLQTEFSGDHSPWDMLERALVLAGFAMRRIFEKRLVTDRVAADIVSIRSFNSKLDGFRRPYIGWGGGAVFQSYDFEAAGTQEMTLNDLSNEIIHSSQLMFVGREPSIPTGLLIASDWHQQAATPSHDRGIHGVVKPVARRRGARYKRPVGLGDRKGSLKPELTANSAEMRGDCTFALSLART